MDKKRFPADIKKILLIQLGDIGDVVWMTPTIRAVRQSIPDSKIYLLVRESFGNLLENDPHLEGIFEVKNNKGNILDKIEGEWRLVKQLRSIRLDMAIDMRAGDRGAFMAFLSGASNRVALHYQSDVPFWRNLVFTRTVRPPAPTVVRGAAEQTLKIVRELGIDTDDTRPKLYVSEETISRARDILRRVNLEAESRLVTINPFSRWGYKEWRDDYWADIIDWLGKERGLEVALIGSPDERKKAEKLISRCQSRVLNLTGQTTLSELSGVLKLSRLHIGVDSAAPHIAAAVGTPTVTIYGPTRWEEWNPIGEEHKVIHPEMDCAPCYQKGCNGEGRSRCLEELRPEKVKQIVSERLKKVLSERTK